MINITNDLTEAEEILKKGKVIVALTDTLYGILGDALNKKTVERIYQIKGRKKEKPFIILIPSTEFLTLFNIKPSFLEKKLIEKKGITVVLDLKDPEMFAHLHRGTGSIAFRIPDKKNLIQLMENIEKPLVAPSANPEGKPPAKDIKKAVDYFHDEIDLYVDEGKAKNEQPSTILKVKDNKIEIIREGSIKSDKILELLKTSSQSFR